MSIYTHFKMNEEEQPLMQKKKIPRTQNMAKNPVHYGKKVTFNINESFPTVNISYG